jgi:hypothetical protein
MHGFVVNKLTKSFIDKVFEAKIRQECRGYWTFDVLKVCVSRTGRPRLVQEITSHRFQLISPSADQPVSH